MTSHQVPKFGMIFLDIDERRQSAQILSCGLEKAKQVGGSTLKLSTKIHTLQPSHQCHVNHATKHGIKIVRLLSPLLVTAAITVLSVSARSQVPPSLDDSQISTTAGTTEQIDLTYVRPTEKIKFTNYAWNAYGPYPIVGAAFTAGINQLSNAPPEWNQGAEGYGKRVGSNFGIALVGTTTRYGLSEVFKQDAMYYRCECQGMLPRLRHAMISTFTARSGEDGHRVFSVPSLVAPYAGSMTAMYGWYPNRYGAKDAFRTGNYSMLVYMGGNIALEFLYSGPHSLLHRMHLSNAHGSPDPGPNH